MLFLRDEIYRASFKMKRYKRTTTISFSRGRGAGLWLFSALFFCAFTAFGQGGEQYMAKRLIIKIKPEYKNLCLRDAIRIPEWENFLSSIDARAVKRKFPFAVAPTPDLLKATAGLAVDISTIYKIDYNANTPVNELVTRVLSDKRLSSYIAYIEPEYAHYPLDPYQPNDPLSVDKPHLLLIQAAEAWGVEQGDTNVVVGIIDTSVNWDHPDLIGNIKYNYADPINGADDDGDGYVDNFHGWDMVGDSIGWPEDNNPRSFGANEHGTMVAGIACATTDNGEGVAGVGFKCKLLPIKCSFDKGDASTLWGAFEGMVYAADHGVQVVNCSFGGTTYAQLGQDIVKYCTFNKNATVVAAAGNAQGTTYFYPGSYDYAYSITATNENDLTSTTYNCKVDASAPGVVQTTSGSNGYVYQGTFTSFATPVASGVCAIIKSHFPTYNAIQVGERMRVTGDDIYVANPQPQYAYSLGKGRINMYRALTINSPAVRLTSYSTSGASGSTLEAGDTVHITGVFRNYLTPTQNLTVSLVTDSPYLTALTPSVTIGSINTLGNANNANNPFRFIIHPDAPENTVLDFRIDYLDGLYTDYECVTFVVNATYINIDVAKVQTTLNNIGKFGYNDYPQNGQGLGFIYNDDNYMYEGGLLLGRSETKIVNNIRNGAGGLSTDFMPLKRISRLTPGALSDQEGVVAFCDSAANIDNRLNVDVHHNAYAFIDDPNNMFILNRYVIKNKNLFLMDSLNVGLFADWDIGQNAANDNTGYDSELKLAYAYGGSDDADLGFVGIVSLTDAPTIVPHNTTFADMSFSNYDKYQALITPKEIGSSGDVSEFLTQGNLAILPMDSITVGFALVAGLNLEELKANAINAKNKYHCMFIGSGLALSLGSDTTVCNALALDVTMPGAVDYHWTTGETSPQYAINSTGTYGVTVKDAMGCTVQDDIFVEVRHLTPHYFVSDTFLNLAESGTIFVADSTPGATSWDWNFGVGFGATGQTATYTYTETGTFTLRLIVSDGVCIDTLKRTIEVVNIVGLPETKENIRFSLYPNPARERFTLRFPAVAQNGQAIIYDAQGRAIITRNLRPNETEAEFDATALPSGTYFCRLTLDGKEVGVKTVRVR